MRVDVGERLCMVINCPVCNVFLLIMDFPTLNGPRS